MTPSASKRMRVLLIDIGNSRIKWRIVDPRLDRPQHDDEAAIASDECGSLALGDMQQIAQRFSAAREPSLAAVHLSNVAGADVEDAMRTAVRAAWGEVLVHALVPNAMQCGVINGYRDKSRLGPDRWAAMLGAHALLPDRDVLVCGFGTATTIDLLLIEGVDGRACFVGGLILPGIEAMRRTLARDTARLPLARGEVVDFAACTADAIASGIVAAQAGAVTRAVRNARIRIAARHREGIAALPFACVLGGGDAKIMAAHLPDIEVPLYIVPDLVLRGLHAVARHGVEDHNSDRIHNPAFAHQRS